MSALAFWGGSLACGVLLGLVSAVIWVRIVPRGATGQMVSELVTVTRELARTDELGDFISLYGRLLRSVVPYIGRNLAGVLSACLPVAIFWALLLPPALDQWGRRADSFSVHPPASGAVLGAPSTNGEIPGRALTLAGAELGVYRPYGRTAFCEGGVRCGVFGLLGFRVVRVAVPSPGVVTVRPDTGDRNPFWPYLSDLEAVFFFGFLFSSVSSIFRPRANP